MIAGRVILGDELVAADSANRYQSVAVRVDRSTIEGSAEYPTLSYNLVTVSGVENPLTAPVYMVKLNTASMKFAGREDVTLTLPNVDGYAPGRQVEMFSYDHDLEEFVAIGLGTVSKNGKTVTSNPGVGVVKAGWHCGAQAGGSGCCTENRCDDECAEENSGCEYGCSIDFDRELTNQTAGNCKTESCGGGGWDKRDVNDKPDDVAGDCKKPDCSTGKLTFIASDETADVKKVNVCKKCDTSALSPINDDGVIGSCKLCKQGIKHDFSSFEDPGGNGLTYSNRFTYYSPGVDWGVTVFNPPVTTFEAYCAGDSWKIRIVSAFVKIQQSVRLLDGVDEVTYSLISATDSCSTLTTMRESLVQVANFGDHKGYYVTAAVQAHEDLHVDRFKSAIPPEFEKFRSLVEGISISLEDAESGDSAKSQILGAADFQQANNAWAKEWNTFMAFEYYHYYKSLYISTEMNVISPFISAIDVRKNALNCSL